MAEHADEAEYENQMADCGNLVRDGSRCRRGLQLQAVRKYGAPAIRGDGAAAVRIDGPHADRGQNGIFPGSGL